MKAKRQFAYEPDYAVAPGETLKEVLDSLGMTSKELAKRTELTEQSIVRILKGDQPISYETANRLELTVGAPAHFWNNLEAEYREQLAKLEERERLEKDLELLKHVPVNELIQRGEIQKKPEKVMQLRETLSFYGVSSVPAWHKVWDQPDVAARRSHCFDSRPGSASAWIRIGERRAFEMETLMYDKVAFKDALRGIRSLTKESPEISIPQIQKLCADSGVALVLVREMKKVPWCGATKWLSPDKAMILLNLRGKGEDIFWFSFFHEASHVLNDSKKDILINDGSKDDPRELRADQFAADWLIPSSHNSQISTAKSTAEISALAKSLNIAPGIVAGRYRHLTKKWNHYQGLTRTFEWKK